MALVDTRVCAHTHRNAVFLEIMFSHRIRRGSDADPTHLPRFDHADPTGSDWIRRGSDALPHVYHVICHIPGAPNILLLKHRRSQEVPREGFLEL